MSKLGQHQTNKRGLTVDGNLVLAGSSGSIYALGDCTATSYAPTAQVASQQGAYLGKFFNQLAKQTELEEKLEELKKHKAPIDEIDTVKKQIEKYSKLKPFHYSHQGTLA